MPYGYTNCQYCGKQVSNRGLKKHIQTCKDCPDSERPLIKEPKKTELSNIAVSEKPSEPKQFRHTSGLFTVKQPKYKHPMFPDGYPKSVERKNVIKNPYTIAIKFIKNQIEDGSININIAQLCRDGRATIRILNQKIVIEIDMAKFRNTFNKDVE